MKNAWTNSFRKSSSAKALPNGSNQGVEVADNDYIYIAGGNLNSKEKPKIAKYVGTTTYSKTDVLTTDSEFTVGKTEIEGLQLKGDRVYYGISNKPDQIIYSTLKSHFK